MTAISRMQFLRGDVRGEKRPVRPPWAMLEEYFIDYCTRCDKCIDACFDELIIKGRGGFPEMDFSQGGCDFCEDCLQVCETQALKKMPVPTQQSIDSSLDSSNNNVNYLPPWFIKVKIDLENCLSMNATICRSCGEACDFEAIQFKLQVGGKARPELNEQQCTGCGSCLSVCPVQVVKLKKPDVN